MRAGAKGGGGTGTSPSAGAVLYVTPGSEDECVKTFALVLSIMPFSIVYVVVESNLYILRERNRKSPYSMPSSLLKIDVPNMPTVD